MSGSGFRNCYNPMHRSPIAAPPPPRPLEDPLFFSFAPPLSQSSMAFPFNTWRLRSKALSFRRLYGAPFSLKWRSRKLASLAGCRVRSPIYPLFEPPRKIVSSSCCSFESSNVPAISGDDLPMCLWIFCVFVLIFVMQSLQFITISHCKHRWPWGRGAKRGWRMWGCSTNVRQAWRRSQVG